MIGVLVNTIAVIVGGVLGLAAKKLIPDSWNEVIIKGLGLVIMYIGISGALKGSNTIILIISIVIGTMIGEGLKIEQRFNAFAENVEKKFDKDGQKSNFAEGFVTASLIMCVGAMAIVGSINAGLSGDNTLLYTKSLLDVITALLLASSLGIGVIFSAAPIFLIQGGVVLLAGLVAPFLGTDVINEMTCAGSIMIVGLGLKMSVGAQLKIMNYLPGIFLPILLCPIVSSLNLGL